MSLDTVPDTIVRLRARLTALGMETQDLLEDIAAGASSHEDRLAVIEMLRTKLEAELEEQEARLDAERQLAGELMARRQDITRHSDITDLRHDP